MAPSVQVALPYAVVARNEHAAGRVEECEVAVGVPRGGDHQNVLPRNRQHVATGHGVPPQLGSN